MQKEKFKKLDFEMQSRGRVLNLFVYFYFHAAVAVVIFLAETQPALDAFFDNGLSDTNIPVLGIWDALTYHRLAAGIDDFDSILILMSSTGTYNLLPPVFLLLILGNNPVIVFCFNLLLLYLSVYTLLKHCQQSNRLNILIFILANPFILISTLAVNKEIVSIASICYLSSYLYSNKSRYLMLAILFAVFSRIELIAVIVLFISFRHVRGSYARSTMIYGFFFALTILIPNTSIDYTLHERLKAETSLGVTSLLNNLQDNYFYFIAVMPKFFLSLFEGFIPINVISPVFYSSCLFLFLGLVIFKKRKANFTNDIFLLIVLYGSIFAMSPLIHHRYLLPLYPLFIILAFVRPPNSTEVSQINPTYIPILLRKPNR